MLAAINKIEPYGLPVVFDAEVGIRFGDFDSYGHVNTKNYIDYVYSSRFDFIRDKFGLSTGDFSAQGFLFFVTRVEMRFKESISMSVHKVRVFSHVESVNRAFLTIKYFITDLAGQLEFSEGNFDCFIIDAKTKRPAKDTSHLPWHYLFSKC